MPLICICCSKLLWIFTFCQSTDCRECQHSETCSNKWVLHYAGRLFSNNYLLKLPKCEQEKRQGDLLNSYEQTVFLLHAIKWCVSAQAAAGYSIHLVFLRHRQMKPFASVLAVPSAACWKPFFIFWGYELFSCRPWWNWHFHAVFLSFNYFSKLIISHSLWAKRALKSRMPVCKISKKGQFT